MKRNPTRQRIAADVLKRTNDEAAKPVWMNKAWNLTGKAGYNMHDEGIWCNLLMLHGQGMTVEGAVAKLPKMLPRLNNPSPGPWTASLYPGEPITSAIQPGRRQDEWHIDPTPEDRSNGVAIIASVHGHNMKNNARLIAAAPDMLAALQGLVAMTEGKGKLDCWDTARAAITKATKG